MFKGLASKFSDIFAGLGKEKTLTTEHVEKAIKEIRIALLDGDVALDAVKSFTASLKERLVGQEVLRSVSPLQMVIKLTQDEVTAALSSGSSKLNIEPGRLNTILMVGLQGAGKTTTTAKLARKLTAGGYKVLMASLDTRRPAAQLQLKILGERAGVATLEIAEGEPATQITKRAVLDAKTKGFNVLLLDTAGRTELDEALMKELREIWKIAEPQEVLMVMDALMGRSSLELARAFNSGLGLTGAVLTRMESDTRGGIAFNIKYALGIPIKFYGLGEKLEDLEEFHPERIASRILDMGDVVTLVEQVKEQVDEKEALEMQKKMEKGQFDLSDFLKQIRSLKKMGGFAKIMNFIPGASKLGGMMDDEKQKQIYKQEAIILSMTLRERKKPEIVIHSSSRKARIASGSGVRIADVNKLLKQFEQMQAMFKKFGKIDKNALSSYQPEDLMKILGGR